MFDLDELERNWQEYYRTKYGKDNLSNEDILEIFKSENATQEYYDLRFWQYRDQSKKLMSIVNEGIFDSPSRHYNDGWDEDISNIDKEEFVRDYEEFKDRRELYNDYKFEDYEREDILRIQLRAEDRFDFSKLHENDEDFLSGSNINPEEFGVDKDFIPHEPSYYLEDYIFDDYEQEYDYHYNWDYKKIQREEARKRNIVSRILMEKINDEEPEKLYLSSEKQKLVVEGCMHLVFERTRFWKEALGEAFSTEELYYACLEELIKATKYCCHYVKPVFPRRVKEFVRRRMFKLMADRMHLTYRELYQKIDKKELKHEPTGPDDHQLFDIPSKPKRDITTDPKDIYLMIKDIASEEEHEKESEAFMEAYYQELNKLCGLEKYVMTMAYNSDGFPGLTNMEIADNLMIDINTVNGLKKKALLKLRKKESIKK